MTFSRIKWLLLGLVAAMLTACSAGDLADRDTVWPDLSDIQPAEALTERVTEPESVIRALREEAERRKDEGYQSPEVATQAMPAEAPDPGGD